MTAVLDWGRMFYRLYAASVLMRIANALEPPRANGWRIRKSRRHASFAETLRWIGRDLTR